MAAAFVSAKQQLQPAWKEIFEDRPLYSPICGEKGILRILSVQREEEPHKEMEFRQSLHQHTTGGHEHPH